MPSPYQDTESQELALRRGAYGARNSGAIGALRKPNRAGKAAMGRALSSGRVERITLSQWWGSIWRTAEAEFADILRAASERAGGIAWNEAAGRFVRGTRFVPTVEAAAFLGSSEFRTVAETRAAARAADMAETLRDSIAVVADRAIFDFRARDRAIRELTEELAARLGPTERQMRRILAWQARAEAEGLPRRRILQGLRRRTHAASLQRARVMASDAIVGQVSEARVAAFKDAGALVYSENMRDDRVRGRHREQTRITRRDPSVPGEPWNDGPPFSGLPPYERRCRCWVERVE